MVRPITRAEILKDVDDFCARHGLTPTEFGLKALNDGSFYGRLRDKNRSPTLSRIEAIYEYMTKTDKKQKGKAINDIYG